MIGGIYCEATLGPVFDNGKLMSAQQKMQKLFNASPKSFRGDTMNEAIVNYWYTNVSRKMAKILSSWKPPTNRGYYNRTVDLTRSICLGIYHNGKLKRAYRFTGGHSEKGALQPSDLGSEPSVDDTARMSWLGRTRHPDPAQRAKQFLEDYDVMYKSGFSIVIAATMPYAVKLEKGLYIPVLSMVVNRMLADVYQFKSRESGVLYGYIFESTGGFA